MSRPELGRQLSEAIARDTGITNERLLTAFAAIPRERFLGPPPWLLAKPAYDGASGATLTETSDPADLYTNVSVALDAPLQLFNGSPAIVATWLSALDPQPGERAYHAGCGSGYYTAILAKLVGLRGSVVAIDISESLLDRAGDALEDVANVSILNADATSFAPSRYDVGLVNMGVTVIPERWLDALAADGGRLQVPLTVPIPARTESRLSQGIVFLIERSGDDFSARMIGGAVIFGASVTAPEIAQRRLTKSLMTGDPREVHSLRRDRHPQSDSCWLHEELYCLSRRT